MREESGGGADLTSCSASDESESFFFHQGGAKTISPFLPLLLHSVCALLLYGLRVRPTSKHENLMRTARRTTLNKT